ncbi:MAG TPA: phosphoesterase [Ruminococcaceae bacterium]|nr:phosphoesterase [Oscillospiraceae bacterium]
MKKNKRNILLPAIAASLAGIGLYADNKRVNIEEIPIKLNGLPDAFNGFRIAHISDLHLPNCVRSPQKLSELVRKIRPDMIALTGDLVDRFSYFDADGLQLVAAKLADIAPCYAVIGNHEVKSGVVNEWTNILRQSGVTVLNVNPVCIQRGESKIALRGLPDGSTAGLFRLGSSGLTEIVLSHYPENMQQYASAGLQLVLAGHAHGGQWRLGGKGLISPGEGLFPKFTNGLYTQNGTQMVVSRGLRRGVPVRIFNAPHLPVVVLCSNV